MKSLNTVDSINREIINCTLCKRLVTYRLKVGKEKVRRYSDEIYWAKPVTGLGDINAELLIIGLAPGAHGANRTGRLFTGDQSGQWVMRALYETGFSNIPTSVSTNDGLILKNVFITSCIRCAPPSNKPLNSEKLNCANYLVKELEFSHHANYRDNDKHLIASYHPSRQNTNTKRLTWPMWIKIFDHAKTILSIKN
jgi:uracil-DNA glycosylase